ncbi:alpha/beta fold hydrolase [Catenulispora sp. NF23]|uniref:alpha/beta fold hydrolase n=1 Tax=Catenulispora pinistramenti TaxID=2705254 RepID=UPI001BA6ED13|nr:alpha/beta fold hydrolase [Catenulispora pinistramenti]MBS2534635.1 alpha/beta fold hydrolase [Catenulispora pinistramenti]
MPSGIRLTDHLFTVPLHHDRPGGEQIEVYAREVTADETRPWLVYLQGGPGHRSPRPLPADLASGWISRALKDYRVLLLDQRGTGRSTPATRQTLPPRGNARQQAEYLAAFRADSIVRDAEFIRRRLTGGAPWSVLGQSFGGFCAVSYLSTAPEGLAEVFITGGLPTLEGDADDVYRAAYPRMEDKNALFYHRHPEDVQTARAIAEHLREHETVLPDGTLLTVEAFQSLGIVLGTTDGAEKLHYLLEDAFVQAPTAARRPELSDRFQRQVESALSFAERPLYAVMHEATYAQGPEATAWAASRVRKEFPRFDAEQVLAQTAAPVLFTGETIHPWHFRTDPALRPLRDVAEAIAGREDWGPLYDFGVLAGNSVPVFATVYTDDLYVDTKHSLATADAIRGLTTRVTDEHEHDGLTSSGTDVLDRLLGMARAAR